MHIVDHLGKNKLFLEFSLSQEVSSLPRSYVIWLPEKFPSVSGSVIVTDTSDTSTAVRNRLGKEDKTFYDFVWSEAGDPARLCLCTDQRSVCHSW